MAAMVCPTCGRAFSTAAARKAHLRTHTGEARDRRPASLSRSGIALIEPKEKRTKSAHFQLNSASFRLENDEIFGVFEAMWELGGDGGRGGGSLSRPRTPTAVGLRERGNGRFSGFFPKEIRRELRFLEGIRPIVCGLPVSGLEKRAYALNTEPQCVLRTA